MRTAKAPKQGNTIEQDVALNEVTCCECGKPIGTIPAWLAGAKVNFQCEECRQKHPRVPGMAEIEPRRSLTDADELGELGDIVDDAAEEEAEEEIADEADEYAE